jgi:hypothetical protein
MDVRFCSTLPACALVFVIVACGSSQPPATPSGDASTPDSGSPPPDGQAADGSLPDVAPADAPPADAPPGADQFTPADTGVPPDTGPGDGAATACVPSTGSMSVTTDCAWVQVAILRNTGAPEVTITGGIIPSNASMPPCAVTDSVDVVSGGVTIATVPGLPGSDTTSPDRALAAAGPANAALAGLCASDSGRFDGIGLVVHGHMDGGTFTATCGSNASGTTWPPSVVLTCHTGLAKAPLASDASVTSIMGFAYDQMNGAIPQPPVVTSIDPTVHIVPGTPPFSPVPLSPSDTMGWMTSVSTMMQPDGSSLTNLSLTTSMDVLGSQLCPVGCITPPCPNPPPVFLARVTGATDSGAFESELYVPMCLTGMQ